MSFTGTPMNLGPKKKRSYTISKAERARRSLRMKNYWLDKKGEKINKKLEEKYGDVDTLKESMRLKRLARLQRGKVTPVRNRSSKEKRERKKEIAEQLKKEGIPNPKREPRKNPKPRLTSKEKKARKKSQKLDTRIRKIYLFNKDIKNKDKMKEKIIKLMKLGVSDSEIKKIVGFDFKK